jgi:hypothetical protein
LKQIKPALIAEACQVVDVLGLDVRIQLLDRYVALELKDYRRIFRATDEAGQLDNISRRFAWFRRLLQTHELEQGRVFPAEWRVGWHLLARFVEITRFSFPFFLYNLSANACVHLQGRHDEFVVKARIIFDSQIAFGHSPGNNRV